MKDYSQIEKAIPQLHKEYKLGRLEENELAADPVEQFAKWIEAAVKAQVAKPDAMVLATASPSGVPSARVVLLKGFDADGFLFFTSYTSSKGRDLEINPRASLVFFWPEIERQVRMEGRVKKLSAQESRRYFDARSRDAKLASLASLQSRPVANRKALEDKVATLKAKYEGRDIPWTSTWGGYRLVPTTFEFWQGREHRLNDRLRYRKRSGRWAIDRLQP
jgi:pyridoxamine 5'-phosphate oxidase